MAETHLNLTQAAKAAGVTRRTLYNHINQGKVTASRDKKNNPVIDISELVRVYGNISLPVKKVPSILHSKNIQDNFTPEVLNSLVKEVKELKQAFTLMLEDKAMREAERVKAEEEHQKLQQEITRLNDELKQEKSKGFWQRFFRG